MVTATKDKKLGNSISIFDALTGQLVEREMTKAEAEQYEADLAKRAQREKDNAKIEADRAKARESALAKLAALGLTEAEVAAL